MSKNKTQKTNVNPDDYVRSLNNESQQSDCQKLMVLFKKITKNEPEMWGTSIIGYGQYTYKYSSGRMGDWMRTGFAPRKNNISVYILPGYQFDEMKPMLERLGKFKHGKACLTFRKLEDIDPNVLEEIVKAGWERIGKLYPANQSESVKDSNIGTNNTTPSSKSSQKSKAKDKKDIKSRAKRRKTS